MTKTQRPGHSVQMLRSISMLALVLAACAPPCDLYCPKLQTLLLVDAAGRPLEPSRVVEPDNRVHDCTTGGVFLTCGTDRVTFDQRTRTTYRLRVEAKTGEVFDADFTPRQEGTGDVLSSSCDCSQGARLSDQTITLTP